MGSEQRKSAAVKNAPSAVEPTLAQPLGGFVSDA